MTSAMDEFNANRAGIDLGVAVDSGVLATLACEAELLPTRGAPPFGIDAEVVSDTIAARATAEAILQAQNCISGQANITKLRAKHRI